MPFWALAYSALLLWSGVVCLRAAREGRRPYWFAALDMLTATAWTIVVATYFVPTLAVGLGQTVIVVAGFALFWTLASAPFEAAQLERPANQDNRRDQVGSWVAVFLSAVFASPAIVLGILAVRRVL